MLNRIKNIIVIGALGPSTKVKYIDDEEFKNQLVPAYAKVERVTMQGKKMVRMIY